MRKLITILLVIICQVIICQVSFGQVYQIMPQYGYSAPRFNTDSTLQLPTFNGVPTLKSNKTNKGAIAIDSTNGRFYFYNPKTSAWSQITGGGGGSTDTSSLSNRINLKIDSIKKSNDSIYYYANGVRTFSYKDIGGGGGSTDTTSLSNRINLKIDSLKRFNDTIYSYKNGSRTFAYTDSIGVAGSATKLITQVYNKTGATITKGSVVYIDGKHSNGLPSIALAQANNEDNSYKTIGLAQDNISTSNSGYIIQAGRIEGLNTNAYTDGDIVYLSPTVAGGFTNVKPLAPNHICKIGSIVNAHPNQGSIEIKIENGWQLDELSDVQLAATPADSTLLFFTRTDSLWKAVTPLNVIGNRYLKPSDSTTYYSKYRSDTSRTNIYSGINGKLNTSDSTIYYSKYRSDTSRTNIYSGINTKLAKSDTSTLSSRIDLKLDKSMSSYTFMANNTTTTANASAQTFKDSGSKVYLGTATFTPLAPSGSSNLTYRWSQIGKLVTLRINISFASFATLTTLVATLPSDCPTPEVPTGLSGASSILYPATGYLFTSTSTLPTTAASTVAFLRINSSNNGYEIVLIRASGSVAAAYILVNYYAQ